MNIDPAPELAWNRRYTSFLDDWTPTRRAAIEERWAAPSVVTSRQHLVLDRSFALMNTRALRDELTEQAEEAGVESYVGRARNIQHSGTGSTVTLFSGEAIQAKLVVDATPTGQVLDREAPGPLANQVTHGQLIKVDRHPFECGEMALMDLRPLDDGGRLPTFLTAMPLDFHHLFVEETSLIATVPVSRAFLEQRLRQRLRRLGIENARVIDVERVDLPMTRALPVLGQRTLGYGEAASMIHPSTGHHIARVLSRAPEVARAICDELDRPTSLDQASGAVWQTIWPRDDVLKWELYTFGARFLFNLDQERTERFFEAFFSLPAQDWSGFFSASLTSTQLAAVMSRVFARLDPALRWDLMRLSAGANSSSTLLRAALAM